MSKKARIRNKLKRDNAKRARREANRAHWAALAGTAANKKRKTRTSVASRTHVRPCGNLACVQCYQDHNDPWKAPRGSCLYGKRWSSPKHRSRG